MADISPVRGERVLAACDTAEIERLEGTRDRNLVLFMADLERGLEAMGTSAAVYGGLRYFDIFKQRRAFEAAHARFAARNPNAKMTRVFARLLQRAQQAEVGSPAPPFTLEDARGREISLSGLRGRWLLVDFWASWCLNCRIEMPRLVEEYEEWRERGFEIIGVTARDSREVWLKTLSGENLPWPPGMAMLR